MTDALVATLPGGYWVNGTYRRDAALRELTGEDQIFLMEDGASLPAAQWTTEVLARCVTRLAPGEPVTREAVRELTVGDREALLLHLRRLALGDRLQCLLTCPVPACGQKLDLDVKVSDLLVSPGSEPAARHELAVDQRGVTYVVRFRLPRGADQEAVAPLARTDPAAAVELMFRRCVESIEGPGGSPQELSAELVDAVSARMAELDAQAELTLSIACSVCGGTFTTVLDIASFLFQELMAGMRGLYREVHELAYHYHWSPSEILALSPRRRRRYLQLLEEQLAHGAGG